jgi:ribonuclease P protein component
MLAKQQRYSFKNGVPQKSAYSPFFVLRHDVSDTFKYAIVVSKKIESNSVDRNRIKRLYRKVISELVKSNPISSSLVFYVRKNSSGVQEEMLKEHLQQILKKEGIISQ